MTPIPKELKRAVEIITVLGDAIQTVRSIPSGLLYASVLGKISSVEYKGALGVLIRAGLVSEKGHMLTWIGPIAEGAKQ